MRQFVSSLRVTAFAAVALTATSTQAASFLTENLSGSFSADSTLFGIAFGSPQPFTLSATFDATAGANLAQGVTLFGPTAVTLDLPGYGTFSGEPSTTLVELVDASNTTYAGLVFPVVAFAGGSGGALAPAYTNSTPVLDATAPVPTVFAGYLGDLLGTFHMPLTGTTGELQVLGHVGPINASLTATAVPEPSAYAAMGGLLLGAFAVVRRAGRASAN